MDQLLSGASQLPLNISCVQSSVSAASSPTSTAHFMGSSPQVLFTYLEVERLFPLSVTWITQYVYKVKTLNPTNKRDLL